MTWLTNPYRFGVPGPPLVGARLHWRIWVVASGNHYMEIAALKMAAYPGGPDLCVGGSAIAGTFTGANNAFDGNSSTFAYRNSFSGNDVGWIGYSFPTPVSIGAIDLQAAASNPIRCPKAFFVQASNDGVTWSAVDLCMTTSSFTASETKSFTVASTFLPTDRANARVWGINVSAGNGDNDSRLAELEFRASSGGATLCSGGLGFQSKGQDALSAPNAFDGNAATAFSNGAISPPSYRLWYVFPTAPDPTHMALRAANASASTRTPQAWTVEWTANGHDWNVVASIASQTGWTTSQWREFAL